MNAEPTEDDLLQLEIARPKSREDCINGIRPCPFISCRYNLYLNIQPGRAPKPHYPNREPSEIPHDSCVLDVADQDSVPLERIGIALNLSRERVRQIESRALKKVQPNLKDL